MGLGDLVTAGIVGLVSLTVHGVVQVTAARALGDAAPAANRITPDPRRHLEPLGAFVVPLATLVAFQTLIGYSKPFLPDARRLRGGEAGVALVAAAGVAAHVGLAMLFSASLSVVGRAGPAAGFVLTGAVTNLMIAAMHLLPVPPLAGSRLIRPLLSQRGRYRMDGFEQYGVIVILVVTWLFARPLRQILGGLADLIVRLPGF